MLITCWSVKGGSGTTVVAASLAVLLARSSPPVTLVDLGGDVAAALGMDDPPGPGALDFMAAGPGVPPQSLAGLAVEVTPNLSLIPAGSAGPGTAADGERLVAALAEALPGGTVVVDAGPPGTAAGDALAAGAGLSLLVVRPCYLALRRAARASVRPSGVVVVAEPGRAIGEREISEVLGVPVRARVPVDPGIARIVDAGLLSSRVPKSLERSLRVAA